MSVSIFDSFLTSSDMIDVFDDRSIIQAMLDFERALALAQAKEGVIPEEAARIIATHCDADQFDIPGLIAASRPAGSLAIPLVKALTQRVAAADKEASARVHWGSTSQDVIDTGLVIVTRKALALIDADLAALTERLIALGQQHLHTPVLARTLMQPAQATSLGYKFAQWAAPLVRSHQQIKSQGRRSLQLQLAGAVGTLAVMGEKGPAVVQRVAASLGLAAPQSAWHTQRDEWVRLGLEVAVLTGNLGKIATDLSLMAQGEIAELAEPSGQGRGGSTAMPHKRNPVSSLIALAGSFRVPQRAAALLACMSQEHERGLGNWQAELAEWPGLFMSAHGALRALRDAMEGLQIDSARMRRNIDSLHGLVFAEAVSIYLAGAIGRPRAHHLMEELTRQTVSTGRPLSDIVCDAVQADASLHAKIDLATLRSLFDPVKASEAASRLAAEQLQALARDGAMKANA